jgi:hypothetical protein
LSLSLFSPKANALTIGEAAITVGVSTAAGAALGASTLPFYGEPGKHTKNIFYGAALGAVVGVLLSAYAGVKGSDEDEEAAAPRRLRREDLRIADGLRFRPALGNASIGGGSTGEVPLAWYPLAQVNF